MPIICTFLRNRGLLSRNITDFSVLATKDDERGYSDNEHSSLPVHCAQVQQRHVVYFILGGLAPYC